MGIFFNLTIFPFPRTSCTIHTQYIYTYIHNVNQGFLAKVATCADFHGVDWERLGFMFKYRLSGTILLGFNLGEVQCFETTSMRGGFLFFFEGMIMCRVIFEQAFRWWHVNLIFFF